MDAKYTAGPWMADPEFTQVWNREGRVRVADCDHKGGIARLPLSERRANMLLIAAAPDLLSALQHLMRYDFGDSEGAKEARAAIAKATGAVVPGAMGAREDA
jgi:hypothetical protein